MGAPTTSRVWWVLASTAVIALGLHIRASQAPSAAQASGLVLGRVIDGTSETPLAGVTITATLAQAAPIGPAIAPPNPLPRIITGNDGVFVFRSLPKGEYTFRATAAGYLPGTAGVNRPDGRPVTVTLGDGEKVNDVVIRLWKGASVTGRVIDESGDSLEGMSMHLLRMERFGARRRFTLQQTATTDDRGMYRIPSISPGEYVVCALFNRHIVPVAAGVAQAAGSPDMQRLMMGTGAQSASGSGYRMGDLILISSSGQRNVDPAPDESGRVTVFADACHPAASTVTAADPVVLRFAEERWVNLTLRVVRGLKLTGTVVGPSGRIGAGLGINLYASSGDDASVDPGIVAANTVTAPDGTFGFAGVPPGSYVVRATYVPRQSFVDLSPEMLAYAESVGIQLAPRAPPPTDSMTEPALWASHSVVVTDTDVTGVALVLRDAARVSGRIAFDGEAKRPEGSALNRLAIFLEPAGGQLLEPHAQPRVNVAADATFQFSGAVPGSYVFRVAGMPPEWRLKSVVANGIDGAADPIEVGATNLSNVVVTFTDKPSALSGTVQDQRGQPDPAASVIVFPADRKYWRQYGVSTSRSANVRTSKTGAFIVPNLPAGEYFVVAVDDRAGVRWQDPVTLATLTQAATRVTIADGERRAVTLTTSRVK